MTRVKSRRSAVVMCMALVAWMEMKEMEMDSMDGAAFVAPHMVFHQNGAILSTPHSRFGMTWMEAKKSRNSKRSTPSSPSRGFAKTKKAQLSESHVQMDFKGFFLPSGLILDPSKTEMIQAY